VVREPAGVKAVDQAEAPAGVRAKAEAPDRVRAKAEVRDRARVDGPNQSIYPVKFLPNEMRSLFHRGFEENERSEFNWSHSTNQRQ